MITPAVALLQDRSRLPITVLSEVYSNETGQTESILIEIFKQELTNGKKTQSHPIHIACGDVYRAEPMQSFI